MVKYKMRSGKVRRKTAKRVQKKRLSRKRLSRKRLSRKRMTKKKTPKMMKRKSNRRKKTKQRGGMEGSAAGGALQDKLWRDLNDVQRDTIGGGLASDQGRVLEAEEVAAIWNDMSVEERLDLWNRHFARPDAVHTMRWHQLNDDQRSDIRKGFNTKQLAVLREDVVRSVWNDMDFEERTDLIKDFVPSLAETERQLSREALRASLESSAPAAAAAGEAPATAAEELTVVMQQPQGPPSAAVASAPSGALAMMALAQSPQQLGPDLWVQDHLVDNCEMCGADFGFFVRRHHCRFCGHIFCGTCSDKTFPLAKEPGGAKEEVRTCRKCFLFLADEELRLAELAEARRAQNDRARRKQEGKKKKKPPPPENPARKDMPVKVPGGRDSLWG